MISYQLTNTDKELEEILDLQQRNLPKNISDKEKKEQGFVTVEHSFDTLKNGVCKNMNASFLLKKMKIV